MLAQTEQIFYVLGDGDKIRDKVELLLFNMRFEDLSFYSQSLLDAVSSVSNSAKSLMDAKVVMAGGDDILLLIQKDKYSKTLLEQISNEFKNTTGSSFSFGVGSTIDLAYLNLRKSKSAGGGIVTD